MIIFGSRGVRHLITLEQLRAARGLLGWSQTELAVRAGLSLPTVRRVETETGPRVSDEAREKLKHVLEVAGIAFLDENGGGAGVRFRKTAHARAKGREREPPPPSLPVGSKGLGRMASMGSEDSMPTMLPSNSSFSRRKDLNKSDRVAAGGDATLTSELMRAARGLLRWAQPDLSAASLVSLATIKRLEAKQGVLAANATTVAALRRALESAGIEFTEGSSPGVKLKGAAVSTAADQRRRGRKKGPQR
jgi:transcriptional regulator with XRE-family HTH domain